MFENLSFQSKFKKFFISIEIFESSIFKEIFDFCQKKNVENFKLFRKFSISSILKKFSKNSDFCTNFTKLRFLWEMFENFDFYGNFRFI